MRKKKVSKRCLVVWWGQECSVEVNLLVVGVESEKEEAKWKAEAEGSCRKTLVNVRPH